MREDRAPAKRVKILVERRQVLPFESQVRTAGPGPLDPFGGVSLGDIRAGVQFGREWGLHLAKGGAPHA